MVEDKESAKERRLEQERKLRRESIVVIAEQAFIENGYNNSMVDDIALRAGYTKVTIYNYFHSKEDLFIAIISKIYENLFATMEEYLQRPGIVYELRSLGDAYLEFVERYPAQSGLFESPRVGITIRNIQQKESTGQQLTESEETFRRYQLKVQELMTDSITRTIANSGIENKVDPFSVIMALRFLNSTIRELVIRGKAGGEPEEKTREYLNVLLNIIDQGLKHYDEK